MTDDFTKAVESALEEYATNLKMPTSEALASIQASAVSLLEGLKKESEYVDEGDEPGALQMVPVGSIDQLIKDLSK